MEPIRVRLIIQQNQFTQVQRHKKFSEQKNQTIIKTQAIIENITTKMKTQGLVKRIFRIMRTHFLATYIRCNAHSSLQLIGIASTITFCHITPTSYKYAI